MDSLAITQEWKSGVTLPAISPEGEIAERLVLLVHYGADFAIWGGVRRSRYWDALLERVKASTYAGPTLSDWWQSISRSLPCAPRNSREREDLVHLLSYEPSRPVLDYLRRHPDILVLRVRLIADKRREAYGNRLEASAEDGEDVTDV
jgi:hypothetical protein